MRARILKILTLLIYGIFAIIFIGCALQSPKGLKYYPQTKEELWNLARDNTINLADIDTSKITDMSYLFANPQENTCNEGNIRYEKDKENLILAVANVHKISYQEAIKHIESTLKVCKYPAREDFSGIESWDTSSVTDMSYMFFGAKSFNQNINSWNVGKVKDMSYMFVFTESFNKPLDKWDTSNVANMSFMFARATSFNQPLNSWNVSRVKDMSYMFAEAKSFNEPLDKWDVSNVVDMNNMFFNAESFNQSLDKWDTSNVTDMGSMFDSAKSFNQNINSWNVSKVKSMWSMFNGSKSFNQDLESWGKKLSKDCEIFNMFYESPLESNPPKWYKKRMGVDN